MCDTSYDSNPTCSYNNLSPVNEDSEALQLPQSSKHGVNFPGDAGPKIDIGRRSSKCLRTLSSEEMLSPFLASTPREEVEAVEELVTILIECLEEVNTKSREVLLMKFFSEIEKEVPLERFIIERLRNSRVRAITELLEKLPDNIGSCQVNSDGVVVEVQSDVVVDSVPTRSIHESVEELSLTLERFKVKTPQVVEVGNAVQEKK